jgi:multidrug efflux pump subunit AcrA (membrane-fusion protein)
MQTRSNPGIILGAVALLLLIILGIWAYVNTRPETASVTRRDIVVKLPLEGQVVAPPSARADIMTPYRAPVDRVFASVGDRVSRGDVLVELSHPSAQAAYEQTRQELKAAEQVYAEAKGQQRAAVSEAEKQLAAARAVERQARAAAAPPAERPEGEEAAVERVPSEPEAAVTIREPAADLAEATQARMAAERALIQAQTDRDAALTPYRQRLEAAQELSRRRNPAARLRRSAPRLPAPYWR